MSETPNPLPSEITDRPHPPRYWWTKRLSLSTLLLLVLLSLARLAWGHLAQQRLQSTIDEISAQGQPISIVPPPEIADDENAMRVLAKAVAAINSNVNTPKQSNLEYNGYPPYPAKWYRLLESGVTGNASAIALIRKARPLHKVDWPANPGPGITKVLPSYNGMRDLANIVGDAAIHAHLHGDDYEAIERIRDVRHMAWCIDQQPFLIGHLVSIGINALGMESLQEITPELAIDSPTSATTRPASRKQIEDLIAELLEAATSSEPLRKGAINERAEGLDELQPLIGRLPLIRPMMQLELRRMLDGSALMIRASTQPTEPEARRVPTTQPADAKDARYSLLMSSAAPRVPRLSRILTAYYQPQYTSHIMTTDFRVRCEIQFVAVDLAVHLYRLDHGDWPASLDALVPKYLPAVPRDLFNRDGPPLRYMVIKGGLPGGKDRPLLYSASGENDVDYDKALVPTVPAIGWQQGSQFRDLERWSPATPTTLPADDGLPG